MLIATSGAMNATTRDALADLLSLLDEYGSHCLTESAAEVADAWGLTAEEYADLLDAVSERV